MNYNPPLPAIKVCGEAFLSVVRPYELSLPSKWAFKNIVVVEGPRAGDRFNIDFTPYLREPLDFLGPQTPVNELAVRKSAQTGFTTLLIVAIGHSIDQDPCRMMVLQPTDKALTEFNREKLQPTIEKSEVLRRKVAGQTSRSAEGSTIRTKKFIGGSLSLVIASSAAELRARTIKKLFRDEIDEYPDDLDGQGDPLTLSDGRQMSFLSSREWKKIDISTPTVKGASKIDKRFHEGDQRYWHVLCPHCKRQDGAPSEFVFEWGANFRFEEEYPFNAYYVAPCCGSIIASGERDGLVRNGHWVASAVRPGAFPSYHFDSLSSPFVLWNDIAKKYLAAKGDPKSLRGFWNTVLGLPYEFKGDAPDHVRLMERREDGFKRGHVPPRGLMLVGAADVQMRGIWVEILAIAPDRQSWVVDAFYIDGGTEAPTEGAFDFLAARTIDREFPDAFGGTRRLDAFAVDSGYRSHVVYAWVRRNQRVHDFHGKNIVLATKGSDGWGRPHIGTAALVDIDLDGHRVKKGCQLWPVGTWPLKAAFYEDLHKEGIKSGAEFDPPGYCHFASWLDEAYFRQITAEYLEDELYRGRHRKIWKIRASERDNHFLDDRIYNMAIAEYLGLSSLTPAEWAAIAKLRGVPDEEPLPHPAKAAPQEDDIFAKFAALNRG